jgi:type II secretory pathway pseudopilin PulG
MKIHNKSRQAGASLMEVMIAMSISLVVTASMIALMANSLSSTARIIQMTKLSDDLRVALQMMSRDVRRSNYNSDSMFCYANEDCTDPDDGSVTATADIAINNSNDCFWFAVDRNHDDYGDADEVAAGGFRRVTKGGVGVIQMWVGGAEPDCSDGPDEDGWVDVTDQNNMDIFGFTIDNSLSYTQVVQDNGFGETLSQRVRKIRMNLQGRLVLDNTITRQMEDTISVRNDFLIL